MEFGGCKGILGGVTLGRSACITTAIVNATVYSNILLQYFVLPSLDFPNDFVIKGLNLYDK